MIALTVPALEAWNFTPSSTEPVSLSLATAGVDEAENRLTGAVPGAETVSATLADEVPPRPSEIA